MADLENLVKTTLSEMREMTRAQSVVGDPVEVGNTTVVPLVRLGYGFGGGGMSGKEEERGGSGGGGGVQPVAVLVVRDGEVRLERMAGQSGFSSATNSMADLVKSVLDRWLKHRSEKKAEP